MEVTIAAGLRPYRALIGSGLLDSAGELVRAAFPDRTRGVIVSDSTVAPLFAQRLQKSLTTANCHASLALLPAGETAKTLDEVARVIEQMANDGLDRQSFVIGLGGGVVGDLSGFVAAIYHRGIPHVQIPTTLLAMVDSSIGGKTGVNTALGKNLIGSIHQPSLVIDDIEILRSLPEREFKQGYAEIIKHAIIADPDLFASLQKRHENETDDLSALIRRNIEIKASIVSGDETDVCGNRAVLNFGHTIGHAVERAGDYRKFLHGEAISLGIVGASRISMRRAGLRKDAADAIESLLQKYSLPTSLPADIDREKIIRAVAADKKFEKGQVRFVVTPKIGSAHLSSEITLDDIKEAVAHL